MANGIRPGSTRIRDKSDWASKSESVGHIESLTLCLIMLDAGSLLTGIFGRLNCLPVIRFTQTHSAARCTQHERQVFGRLPTGLLPRFMCGEQQQFCSAVHSLELPCR